MTLKALLSNLLLLALAVSLTGILSQNCAKGRDDGADAAWDVGYSDEDACNWDGPSLGLQIFQVRIDPLRLQLGDLIASVSESALGYDRLPTFLKHRMLLL